MKKTKVRNASKKTKPAIVARAKTEGRGTRADSCAGCAGSKIC